MDPTTVKPQLGLAGRDVILSFGLLGPGKGYELAIDALPAVVAAQPGGAVRDGRRDPSRPAPREGEAYRRALVDRVARLGHGGPRRFVDRFVGRVELTRWLEAADMFVTPYPNLDQIVSGTLSYAMGAGRGDRVDAIRLRHELLADGRGVLVAAGLRTPRPTRSSEVLGDPELRAAIGRRAYAYSRRMMWPAVGAEYRRVLRTEVAHRRRRTCRRRPAGRWPPINA